MGRGSRQPRSWPDQLAIPELQARLDARSGPAICRTRAFLRPGMGACRRRNATTSPWSEYHRHHMVGALSPGDRPPSSLSYDRPSAAARVPLARNLAAMFLALAAFLLCAGPRDLAARAIVGFVVEPARPQVLAASASSSCSSPPSPSSNGGCAQASSPRRYAQLGLRR